MINVSKLMMILSNGMIDLSQNGQRLSLRFTEIC
jgi:hypothetical protein